jgi:dihydrofolate reductase
MGSIKSNTMVTVDGVAGAPENWQFQYFSPEMGEVIGRQLASADALLLGRVTYQEFAQYWPTDQAQDNPFAPAMNGLPKYVVSTTLAQADWNNSTIIKGDVPKRLRQLKNDTAGDINLVGSPTLVGSLLAEGLIDQLSIMVFPLVLGSGRRLFENAAGRASLELAGCHQLANGVLHLDYRPGTFDIEEQTA